ncbi:hypothetical protein VCRA2126O85_230048 [Vibrio crassostreae]|nr:hypothetical protein VCRA2126O85_230048 [Vibrio crassostreae]CAK2775218.1 hypothetical protein VCRA2126O86_240048 [Vibrio crassostreae]CAK3254200.1 hypothetical protein VCRA2128O102_210049 [Vibrio crassostreae]CAK3369720.1 hypothetical protein VCRA2126O87_240041 [Vibrio crassostreae]CAK3373652.1 hypothetical protein VCRA2126O88_250048 [Vibrio crassostreae]
MLTPVFPPLSILLIAGKKKASVLPAAVEALIKTSAFPAKIGAIALH